MHAHGSHLRLCPSWLAAGTSKWMPTRVGCAQLLNTPLLSAQQHGDTATGMKINSPLTRTHLLRRGCQGWVQTQPPPRGDSGYVCTDTHGRVQAQFPQLTPTSIVPPAPARDPAVKHFCYQLASQRRHEKQLFQSHRASFVRLAAKSAKESGC